MPLGQGPGEFIYLFKGLRPLAAGPLSWILAHRWIVTACWGLLAGDCWLAILCLWMAQGKQEACRRPQESFRRARDGSRRVPRWLQVAFERVQGAMGGPRKSTSGHERFELTFSYVCGPSGALSLCFQCFGFLGRSRLTPVQPNRPRPNKDPPLS